MRISVVVGIIQNEKDQLLIAKRPERTTSAGFWEFPGGKVDAGENHKQALLREIKEEVDLEIISAEPFMQMDYDGEQQVALDIWYVTEYTGEAFGAEGQKIQWCYLSELSSFNMLPANASLVVELEKHFL